MRRFCVQRAQTQATFSTLAETFLAGLIVTGTLVHSTDPAVEDGRWNPLSISSSTPGTMSARSMRAADVEEVPVRTQQWTRLFPGYVFGVFRRTLATVQHYGIAFLSTECLVQNRSWTSAMLRPSNQTPVRMSQYAATAG